MADLDEIMAGGGEPAPTPAVQTQPQTQEPQAQVPGNEPPAGDEDEADPITGLRKALDAERGKGRKYKETVEQFERRLEAMDQRFSGIVQLLQAQQRPTPQPEAAKPDFFENPDGFINHALQPLAQQQEQQREAFSRMMAVDKFGEETVNTAFTELSNRMRTDPSVRFDYQRIMASPHPFGALVQWHKQQSAISEIGTDPQAFREKLRAELLAELQGQGADQSQPQPTAAQPQVMPTSFAGTRSAGPRTAPGWSGPKPLSELMPR